MTRHDEHLRQKALQLRAEHQLSLDEIVERLKLPRGTVYHWIKDIPIPAHRQQAGQRLGTAAMQAKYAALRDAAYAQGLAEAPERLRDPAFRDFVVLYMAEGSKRKRNEVEFVNSDAQMVALAHRWLLQLAHNPLAYRLQYHADHDTGQLQNYWAGILSIEPDIIKLQRKSNSGQLARRQFRSQYGLLSVSVGDTYLRARLQAWMDTIKAQW